MERIEQKTDSVIAASDSQSTGCATTQERKFQWETERLTATNQQSVQPQMTET
jgi:hypothetical protein